MSVVSSFNEKPAVGEHSRYDNLWETACREYFCCFCYGLQKIFIPFLAASPFVGGSEVSECEM